MAGREGAAEATLETAQGRVEEMGNATTSETAQGVSEKTGDATSDPAQVRREKRRSRWGPGPPVDATAPQQEGTPDAQPQQAPVLAHNPDTQHQQASVLAHNGDAPGELQEVGIAALEPAEASGEHPQPVTAPEQGTAPDEIQA